MIVDHVFRAAPVGGNPGRQNQRVPQGTCVWNGTCGRPQDDHITVPDYRARRGAR